MKRQWCWRCNCEMPMVDEAEWSEMLAAKNTAEVREQSGVKGEAHENGLQRMLESYIRITGFSETNPAAVWHHRLALYGPPCSSCGKPLRTSKAKLCAACGARASQNGEPASVAGFNATVLLGRVRKWIVSVLSKPKIQPTYRQALSATALKCAPPNVRVSEYQGVRVEFDEKAYLHSNPSVAATLILSHIVHRLTLENFNLHLSLKEAAAFIDSSLFHLLAPGMLVPLISEGIEPDRDQIYYIQDVVPAWAGIADREEVAKRMVGAQRLALVLIEKANADPVANDMLYAYLEAFWKAVRAYVWTADENIIRQLAPMYPIYVNEIWGRMVQSAK